MFIDGLEVEIQIIFVSRRKNHLAHFPPYWYAQWGKYTGLDQLTPSDNGLYLSFYEHQIKFKLQPLSQLIRKKIEFIRKMFSKI